MTTEQKAKAYDEALERARKIQNGEGDWRYSDPIEIGPALIEIFPSLRESESEDEKTRKRLIEFISDIKRISESGRTTWVVRKNDIEMCNAFLSYLEKQKELPISAEEVLTKAGLKPYKDGNQWCILAGDNIQEGICGFGDTIEDALYEFLKEVLDLQKKESLRDFIDNYPYSCEQKKQEPIEPELKIPDWVYGNWDDEYMINTVIGRYSLHAEVAKKRGDTHDYNLSKSMENWLRNVVKPSILEKQKEQKFTVWTEEDEEIREHLINICNEWIDGGWSARPCGNDIKWLKNLLEGQKEQKSIEDVVKDITKNKESAIKFLKSAGIMDDNGELAEMYRSEQESIELNYDNRIQYDSIKSGIEAFASTYSFNIESKLFPQLTKEQQRLWRKEIEQAVIAGGENGVEFARDNRYKENRTIEWSEEDERMLKSIIWHLRYSVNNGDIEHTAGQLEFWLKSLRPS